MQKIVAIIITSACLQSK